MPTPETTMEPRKSETADTAALLLVRIVSGVGTPADVEQLRELRAARSGQLAA